MDQTTPDAAAQIIRVCHAIRDAAERAPHGRELWGLIAQLGRALSGSSRRRAPGVFFPTGAHRKRDAEIIRLAHKLVDAAERAPAGAAVRQLHRRLGYKVLGLKLAA